MGKGAVTVDRGEGVASSEAWENPWGPDRIPIFLEIFRDIAYKDT
jgi:hypothetical protein